MVLFEPQLLGADPEEILSRIFHLSDAGPILITANFLVTTYQYPAFLQGKWFTLVVPASC